MISSSVHNVLASDLASALTQSISRDGQTIPIGNLPMGGFRLTGLGNGIAATDSAALGQVATGINQYVLDTSVTVNQITIAPVPAITAYAAGQTFRIRLNTTNTGATNISVSGLANQPVRLQGGGALNVGLLSTLKAGRIVLLVYDGVQFIVHDVSSFGITGISAFTGSGTYTRPAGTTFAVVHLVGGGGGGGGGAGSLGTQSSAGGGGAGGGSCLLIGIVPGPTEAVTIGAGGAGATGAGVFGVTGGTTSFGAHGSATGGTGGEGGSATGGVQLRQGGTGGGGTLGVITAGAPGGHGIANGVISAGSGFGGMAGNGGGGGAGRVAFPSQALPGLVGGASGGGGSGGATCQNLIGQAGGAGASGRCIVYSYGF